MFLGIDLGTSACKLLLIDAKGKVLASVSKTYPVNYFNQNWAEQNPEDWWKGVKEGIEDIMKGVDRSQLRSISFSGQMHGLVILDKENKVIRPAILWCDQRTQKECDYLNNDIGTHKMLNWTGNIALTGFTAPKLFWVKNNEPENFKKINKVLLPKDYIAFKLSGEFTSDVSDASGTVYFDVKKRKYSSEIIDLIGLKPDSFPKVYESYEAVGKILPELASEMNLPSSVLIVAGAGDQAAGAVGTGAVEEGIISVALGTSGVVFAPNDAFTLDKKHALHSFAHANGQWHQMGVILSAASCLKWWVEDVNGIKDYDLLLSEAEKVPAGSERLFFVPYLIGERTPHNDPNAKGCFIGLNVSHKRGNMTRAVLEGVAFALRDTLELLKESGISAKEIIISGGGSKGKIWNQIVADVFSSNVKTLVSNEGPAYGAALLAAVGAGEFSSVKEACSSCVNYSENFTPDSAKVVDYNRYYEVYRSLYDTLKSSFAKISAL